MPSSRNRPAPLRLAYPPRNRPPASHPPERDPSLERQHERLFTIFISCRTTFEDLSRRTKAFGGGLSVAVMANYLIGRTTVSAAIHNVMADAINARLLELSRPADAPYRPGRRHLRS